MKNENYISFTGYMVNVLNLSGNELLVYAVINHFSQHGSECKYTGSLNYLCECTNISRRCAIETLKRLQAKGFINKTERFENGQKFCAYEICTPGAENALPPVQNVHYPPRAESAPNIRGTFIKESIVEKEIVKEKDVAPKGATLDQRMKNFFDEVGNYSQYPTELLQAFFNYWSEPNQSRTKMRWELEKTWDTKRRLATWARNQKTFNNGTNQQPYQSTAERNRQELQQSAWRVLAKYSDN